MANNSNMSAILDVVTINKEMPSLKDAIEIDPHSPQSNSNNSIVSLLGLSICIFVQLIICSYNRQV